MKKVLVVVMFVLLVAAIGFQQYQIITLTERVESEASERQALAVDLDKNLLGDCINESIFRQIIGAPKIDREGCIAERNKWYEKFLNLDKGVTQRLP